MTAAEYNKCVDSFSDGVYRFVLKNLKDKDKAKDVVQESFAKLWEKVETIHVEKARSYLFTTAYHTLIDSIRRESRMSSFDTIAYNTPSANRTHVDLKQVLQEAVDKLPAIQRSVVMLRDYEGYSYEEIGKITELNEAQVKVYIYRARVFLKNYIGSLDKVI